MTKYRKKPIIIEADQRFPGKEIEGVIVCPENITSPYVITLEGNMRVSESDYIITGIKGEKYPCKPDIFEASYDLVGE